MVNKNKSATVTDHKNLRRRPKGARLATGSITEAKESPARSAVATTALTLDEFVTLTRLPKAYVCTLVDEGMFNEALTPSANGVRIGLAALPMFELVTEVAERVAAGSLTLRQADHVLTE